MKTQSVDNKAYRLGPFSALVLLITTGNLVSLPTPDTRCSDEAKPEAFDPNITAGNVEAVSAEVGLGPFLTLIFTLHRRGVERACACRPGLSSKASLRCNGADAASRSGVPSAGGVPLR